MSAHFLFQKPTQLAMTLILVILGFASTGLTQGASLAPTNSTTMDSEDEALPPKTSGQKGVHPEDGSDLVTTGLEKTPIYWMCRNRAVVRTLQIEVRDGGCRTHYSKDGVQSMVSQSQAISNCVNIFANIRRNLEVAGWKCRDISRARISENP